MKQFKNATLAVIGGLVMLSLATVSCSPKKSGSSNDVTVTGVTPNPATTGSTVTITGTGFASPATVTVNGVAATDVTVVNATTITFTAPASATSGPVIVTSNGGAPITASTSLSVIVPGPTSDSVATSALVAKWTFDADSKEFFSSHAAQTTVGTVDYSSAGQIGNCATFTDGALLYNPISQINNDTSLESYTISLWANFAATTGSEPLRSLFQMTGTKYSDLWGQVDLEFTNSGISGDSLTLGARQHQQDGHAPYDHEGVTTTNQGGVTGKWVLLTETYNGNGVNETMQIYVNGQRVDSAEFVNVTKPETFNLVPSGNYPADGFVPATKVYIGSLAFYDRGNNVGDGYGNTAPNSVDRPWAAASITGKLDDIRVYNRALTATEVADLYTYGTQGK